MARRLQAAPSHRELLAALRAAEGAGDAAQAAVVAAWAQRYTAAAPAAAATPRTRSASGFGAELAAAAAAAAAELAAAAREVHAARIAAGNTLRRWLARAAAAFEPRRTGEPHVALLLSVDEAARVARVRLRVGDDDGARASCAESKTTAEPGAVPFSPLPQLIQAALMLAAAALAVLLLRRRGVPLRAAAAMVRRAAASV